MQFLKSVTIKTALSPIILLFIVCSLLNAQSNVLPVLDRAIENRKGFVGQESITIDLNDYFSTAPIDNQVVRFTSNWLTGGEPLIMDFALFSGLAPATRTNFLNYVNDGDYDNSIVHRSDPGFVLQGGGFALNNAEDAFEQVPQDPQIPLELNVSNTFGTIAMARRGDDINSATNQWFINMNDNTALDTNAGGYAVFARVTRSTLNIAMLFNGFYFGENRYFLPFNDPYAFPLDNESDRGAFQETPIFTGDTGTTNIIDYMIIFPDVSLVPIEAGDAGTSTILNFSIDSIGNDNLITAEIINGNELQLSFSETTAGATEIRILAEDSVGNQVFDLFVVTVTGNYSQWKVDHFTVSNRKTKQSVVHQPILMEMA